MKKDQIKIAQILTYAGTLPFILSALINYFPQAGFEGWLLALSYGAIIISFLCGIHWAIYLFFAEKCPYNFLIISNFIALFSWVSLLFLENFTALIVQIFLFIFLLVIDWKLFDLKILPKWFFVLRKNATIVVVTFLAIIAYGQYYTKVHL